MKVNIRIIYLYLFSAIGLVMVVIAFVNMIDLGLRTFIFTNADQAFYVAPRVETLSENEQKISAEQEAVLIKSQTRSQNQREVSNALAMLAVGIPLYLYHWKTIQKNKSS